MCILFSYCGDNDANSDYKLILAENRDEYYDRAALNLSLWNDSNIVAGRDLGAPDGDGTWMAVSPQRRKLGVLLNLPYSKRTDAKKPRKNKIISSSSDEEDEPPRKRHKRILPVEDSDDEEEENKNILQLIGEPEAKKNVITIDSKLADLWRNIIKTGLNKEVKKKLEEKIPSIENCVLEAPKLNEEIKITLNKSSKTRDEKLCEKQNQIGLVMANLNNILKSLIDKKDKDNIEPLGDSIRLLADLHFMESETRKAVILPGLNKNLKESLEKTDTGSFLFGTDLHKVIKKSKDIEKSIKDLQSKNYQNKTLNYWTPPSNSQTQGGQRRNYLQKIRNHQRNYYRFAAVTAAAAAAAAAAPPARRPQYQWSPRQGPTRGRRHQHASSKK